jgi:hypothetical protein
MYWGTDFSEILFFVLRPPSAAADPVQALMLTSSLYIEFVWYM